MRYQVWGIKRFELLAAALFPLFSWAFFRWYDEPQLSLLSLFNFYRPYFLWSLPLYVLFSAAWIILFRRGWFAARFCFYAIALSALAIEIYFSVSSRDFTRVGIGLVFFVSLFGIYRWLENQVGCAHFNPRIRWFEGEPKTIPLIQAKVKLGEDWHEASVRTCDERGFFLLFQKPLAAESLALIRARPVVAFELNFRKVAADGEAKIMSLFSPSTPGTNAGLGLQFLPKDLYHFSQYTALIESLKGEGYAT
jgi:hypothetical protein